MITNLRYAKYKKPPFPDISFVNLFDGHPQNGINSVFLLVYFNAFQEVIFMLEETDSVLKLFETSIQSYHFEFFTNCQPRILKSRTDKSSFFRTCIKTS